MSAGRGLVIDTHATCISRVATGVVTDEVVPRSVLKPHVLNNNLTTIAAKLFLEQPAVILFKT